MLHVIRAQLERVRLKPAYLMTHVQRELFNDIHSKRQSFVTRSIALFNNTRYNSYTE